MINKLLYKLSYEMIDRNTFLYYEQFLENNLKSIEQLEKEENLALQRLIKHAFTNIPYYTELSQKLNLSPEDIKCKKDLMKLPILTKTIIKSRPQDFIYEKDIEFKIGKTGGSTGTPLSYRMSKECYYRGTALRLARYKQAGYNPGDFIINLGGGSLVGDSSIKSKLRDLVLNNKSYSSYGFTNEIFSSIFSEIRRKKVVYLYGYASSLYLFSKYLIENDIYVVGKGGIFSTAEQLFEFQRNTIQSAFPNCEIFDMYGLNDGGITAGECSEHNGMHIDFGRGLVEVVDGKGTQIFDKSGSILATSLYNYAFPFIRYDTGDLGSITYERCNCGLDTPRLVKLEGRKTDYLEFAGRKIGSPVLTVLMSIISEVDIYRVIQKESGEIIFRLCLNTEYVNNHRIILNVENRIKNSILDKLPGISLKFEYFNSPLELMTDANKHRIIINEQIVDRIL